MTNEQNTREGTKESQTELPIQNNERRINQNDN